MDLEQIFEMYMNDIYRYLFSLTQHHAQAEDLLQETFIKVHITLLAKPIDDIRPWLFKVAYYSYIDWIRKQKRIILTNEINQVDERTPEQLIIEQHSYLHLLNLLNEIKPIERHAILLCDVHECTYEQVAEILNVNINTVKSHVARGRKKMRELLSKGE
ncbi:MAG: sigma-70 family RNA polymerase sigma factor [Solibacillus sp.]